MGHFLLSKSVQNKVVKLNFNSQYMKGMKNMKESINTKPFGGELWTFI